MNPYIGITDFLDFEQVNKMLEVFNQCRHKDSNRQLHVGVMMSRKTLLGIPSKWLDVFPKKETLSQIFFSDDTYNCLHYADYTEDVDLVRNLSEAIGWGGVGIHALQLDMIWPDSGRVAQAVHVTRKSLEVILQVGQRALDEAEHNPSEVVKRLGDYQGVIHRVLLDQSMGRGIGMDAKKLLPFVQAIKERFPEFGITVAGGLGPNTMHLVEPLMELFPDLSIDAQGQLRPSGNPVDPIDWRMAEMYLRNALQRIF